MTMMMGSFFLFNFTLQLASRQTWRVILIIFVHNWSNNNKWISLLHLEMEWKWKNFFNTPLLGITATTTTKQKIPWNTHGLMKLIFWHHAGILCFFCELCTFLGHFEEKKVAKKWLSCLSEYWFINLETIYSLLLLNKFFCPYEKNRIELNCPLEWIEIWFEYFFEGEGPMDLPCETFLFEIHLLGKPTAFFQISMKKTKEAPKKNCLRDVQEEKIKGRGFFP